MRIGPAPTKSTFSAVLAFALGEGRYRKLSSGICKRVRVLLRGLVCVRDGMGGGGR